MKQPTSSDKMDESILIVGTVIASTIRKNKRGKLNEALGNFI